MDRQLAVECADAIAALRSSSVRVDRMVARYPVFVRVANRHHRLESVRDVDALIARLEEALWGDDDALLARV